MAEPNPHRGEVKITLAGQDRVLRPTFQALVEIEVATGMGVARLWAKVAAQDWSVRDFAAILAAGMKAAGGLDAGATPATVGPLIVAEGIKTFVIPVLDFLEAALAGGETAKPGAAAGEA